MASQIDPRNLELEEQIVRTRKDVQEIEQISAQTRKLFAESKVVSVAAVSQAFLAAAALSGAGAAIAKLFFP